MTLVLALVAGGGAFCEALGSFPSVFLGPVSGCGFVPTSQRTRWVDSQGNRV